MKHVQPPNRESNGEEGEKGREEHFLSSLLESGIVTAVLSLGLGVLVLLRGHDATTLSDLNHYAPLPLDFSQVLAAAGRLDPLGLLSLGIGLLVLTQVAVVVAAGALFLLGGDLLFAIISGTVLFFIIAGMSLGLR